MAKNNVLIEWLKLKDRTKWRSADPPLQLFLLEQKRDSATVWSMKDSMITSGSRAAFGMGL